LTQKYCTQSGRQTRLPFFYLHTSLLCGLSTGISGLIVFRVLQAAGAASAATMALAPMLAPVFGGWVTTWFSWRWIFVI